LVVQARVSTEGTAATSASRLDGSIRGKFGPAGKQSGDSPPNLLKLPEHGRMGEAVGVASSAGAEIDCRNPNGLHVGEILNGRVRKPIPHPSASH